MPICIIFMLPMCNYDEYYFHGAVNYYDSASKAMSQNNNIRYCNNIINCVLIF